MDGQLDSWLTVDFWRERLVETAEWAVEAVPKLLLIFFLALLILKIFSLGLRKLEARLIARHAREADVASVSEHEKRIRTLMGIMQKVGAVAIWTMLTLIVLLQLGIDVGPLIAGAGVIGLAVGFGAQELVRDVISGFFMLLENHIRAGDVAVINGTSGLVEQIGLRTLALRDLSGVVHTFQNGKIDTIANMTKEWSAVVFDIEVAYKEDTDEVSRVVERVGEELREDEAFSARILEPLELFGVDSLGESAVVIKARFKTTPGDQWAVGREYRRRLKQAFDAEGIEIPFPHQTLQFGEAGPVFKVQVEA